MSNPIAPHYLTAEQEAEILAADEARELPQIEAALAEIDRQWPEAVKLATDPLVHPGDSQSKRDLPLLRLIGAHHALSRQLGVDPETVKVSRKAAAGEAALPKRLRDHFRRNHHVRAALDGALNDMRARVSSRQKRGSERKGRR